MALVTSRMSIQTLDSAEPLASEAPLAPSVSSNITIDAVTVRAPTAIATPLPSKRFTPMRVGGRCRAPVLSRDRADVANSSNARRTEAISPEVRDFCFFAE